MMIRSWGLPEKSRTWAGSTATGMKPTEESALFRFTFWHSVLLVAMIGLVTTIYAYVIPWMVAD